MRANDWGVYAKTPLAGPAAVLDYLSRYTHRTAIGQERLLAIDDACVRLRLRGEHASDKRSILVDGGELIARLLQHVLPPGFKRIQHYGLLAPAAKAQRLGLARRLLQMPALNPRAQEHAQDFMRRIATIDVTLCPYCRQERLQLVCERAADRTALARSPPILWPAPP